MRQQGEEQAAIEAITGRPVRVLFDLRARGLDQPIVADAGRARGEAAHAAQAGVHVARELIVDRRATLEHRLHQVDAAARRVGFASPEHVGGTRRQAEAAVHAVVREGADVVSAFRWAVRVSCVQA